MRECDVNQSISNGYTKKFNETKCGYTNAHNTTI